MHHEHTAHSLDDSLGRHLDLDALVHADYLDELLDRVAEHHVTPRRIVDIGAGTGTGTMTLARQFPDAVVVAVDNSEAMLARIRDTAHRHGISNRVQTVLADLDEAPDVFDDADLVWSALSLHHVQDPEALLQRIGSSMNPAGLLLVVEMDGQPRFLPGDAGVEQRCRELAATLHPNPSPDWTDVLKRTGFAVSVRRRDLRVDEVTATVREYADLVLGRMRTAFGDRLSPQDVAELDRLLGDGSESLWKRDDLVVRSSRAAWVARPLSGKEQ